MSERVAIVTGAGGELGRATAQRLAAAGFTVVRTDRSEIVTHCATYNVAQPNGTCMLFIADPGLMLTPPVSKVMPLPTMTTCTPGLGRLGRQLAWISRGGADALGRAGAGRR